MIMGGGVSSRKHKAAQEVEPSIVTRASGGDAAQSQHALTVAPAVQTGSGSAPARAGAGCGAGAHGTAGGGKSCDGGGIGRDAPAQWVMPDETGCHERTWMAFGASDAVWHPKLQDARLALATIAATLSHYEPVTLLVRTQERGVARGLLAECGAATGAVTLVDARMDDLWARDTGPVFVRNATTGTAAAVCFNFNGWGGKQKHRNDKLVAESIAKAAGVPLVTTELCLEGGSIEVDGEGTAIITESCVLNANRNPHWLSKAAVERELQRLIGVTKVIWLPGIKGKDITDGHTDFYARFAVPGTVVVGVDPDPTSYDHAVTNVHLEILRSASDAKGRALKVVEMHGPCEVRPEFEAHEDFAAGYVNFYVANGVVLLFKFGDAKADRAALETLQGLFPDRDVVALEIDAIAWGGGGIHCCTQQQPAPWEGNGAGTTDG